MRKKEVGGSLTHAVVEASRHCQIVPRILLRPTRVAVVLHVAGHDRLARLPTRDRALAAWIWQVSDAVAEQRFAARAVSPGDALRG